MTIIPEKVWTANCCAATAPVILARSGTLGAVNREDGNLRKLHIFDLRTQKWTDLVTITDQIENEINSPDVKYAYFCRQRCRIDCSAGPGH
jgi:hypothetical protein